MEPIVLVTLLALLVEVLIEAVMPLSDPVFAALKLPESVNPYLYLSALVGVLAALGYGADLVAAIGLPAPNGAVGLGATVATGLMVGRGANFVHDAIKRVAGATS